MLSLPRISRPSPALIVAIVALFMALGGTSYAALKITGKNVQNSTLTGADFKNKSLGGKEMKKNTLGGEQINESKLGTVPSAAHAASADNAVNAQTAAKAADADKIGGLAPSDLMLNKTRAYEASISSATNFANLTTRGSVTDIPAGTYLVMARLGYHNDGVASDETCTLNVPGSDDRADFRVSANATEQVTLTEIIESTSLFMVTVNCTSDGTDDIDGTGGISVIRLD